MNPNDRKKNPNAPRAVERNTQSRPDVDDGTSKGEAAKPDKGQKPESQPHGTTQDQINEMESEGQATKRGQKPNASESGTQATRKPGQKDEKRNTM